jgi:hypothetical protein
MTPNCGKCLYQESHRCRIGIELTCPEGMKFVEYTGSTVKQCIEATVEEYQDGYIHCPIIDCMHDCEWCMERLNSDEYVFVRDERQNYKRFSKKKGA